MKMKKNLTFLHVFCIAAGAMISSGIFVLPGLAHARAGSGVIFSYLIAGLLAGAGLLSIAELTTAMPKPGGDYFYISRGLGPAVGTIAGLLSWFSLSIKSAFALIGIAALLSPYLPFSWHIAAAVLCVVFVGINLLGARQSAGFQVALVAVLITIMAAFVIGSIPSINMSHFQPVMPHGVRSIFSTAGFVFISYGGLIKVASMAGEIREPGRIIPRAMIAALVLMIVLYIAMIFAAAGVLPAEKLDESLKPISDAARSFWGTAGYVIVSIAASLAFITTANAGILTASRYLLALSRDELLPPPLSKVSRRFRTPYVSTLITGAIILGAVFVSLDILAESASVVFVLSYILGSLSVIIIRESGIQNYRPSFRAPFYPWLQLLTIISLIFVLVEMGERAFAVTAVIIVVGFLIYWLYGRKRIEKEYALLHLIERVTSKELVTGRLESELKDIVLERDEIVQDQVDHLVENAVVVDRDEPMDLEAFFDLAADKLAPKLSLEPEAIKTLLLEREQVSSTVLTDDVAVPHVMIEDPDCFEMLIARCKGGIAFSEQSPEISAVFLMVSGKEQRNLYLRVLSAIAHIVQKPGFQENWPAAGGKQALKDLVLLSERNRPE